MLSNQHTPTIIADICINWLQFSTKQKDSRMNLELYPGNHMITRPEGVFLISEFLWGAVDTNVFSPELQDIENFPPEVLCSQR